MMLRVPFALHAYPGEMFGSWMARCRLHNGNGAWNALHSACGFPKTLKSMFDTVAYSTELEAFLGLLGMTYPRAMLEHSTLPYWLAFEPGPQGGEGIPGMDDLPKPMVSGRAPTSMALFGNNRGIGEAVRGRYCPDCLEEDRAQYGEPYWHREHQLNNVFFCTKHRCATRTACPNCDRAVSGVTWGYFELPKLRCPCGADLRATEQPVPRNSPFMRLAQFSEEVLSTVRPDWHRGQVKTYAQELLHKSSGGSRVSAFANAIERKFGEVRVNGGSLYVKVPGSGGNAEIKLSRKLSPGRSDDFCALLVALDVDWVSAQSGFRLSKSYVAAETMRRGPRVELTIESAREKLLGFRGCRREYVARGQVRAYWFLRIYDSEWIASEFPSSQASSLPSIEADRKSIEMIVSGPDSLRTTRAVRISTSFAGVRANHRDKDWLNETLAQVRSQSGRRGLRGDKHESADRAAAIKEAIRAILAEDGKPYYIALRRAAAKAGLSAGQCIALSKTDPSIWNAIRDANSDLVRRKLRWAAHQLLVEGKEIGKAAIAVRASVPYKAQVKTIAAEIIDEIGADLSKV